MPKILNNADDMVKILDAIYEKSINGIPKISPEIDEMVSDYTSKNDNPRKAARSLIDHQIAKCTVSGFVTGFGGVLAMPVTIPANLSSVMYIQMRMIAAVAAIGGYDVHSDQVQTLVYACLAGVSANQIAKKFGVQFGQKLAIAGIKRIPGKVLVKINQRIGFRFITKFGEKGLINLGKMVPGVGAAVNGGFDFVETRSIGNRAYKMFIEGNFDEGEELNISDDSVIDVEPIESE